MALARLSVLLIWRKPTKPLVTSAYRNRLHSLILPQVWLPPRMSPLRTWPAESWDLVFLVCHPSIPVRLLSIFYTDDVVNKFLGKPFFTNLAAGGWLEYPLFAFSLTMNSSGTLTLGAIDASVVKNPALISWNQVVQFPPFAAESNESSYLEWAIPIAGFSVNYLPRFSIWLTQIGDRLTTLHLHQYQRTQIFRKRVPLPSLICNSRYYLFCWFSVNHGLLSGSPGIYGPYQDVREDLFIYFRSQGLVLRFPVYLRQ